MIVHYKLIHQLFWGLHIVNLMGSSWHRSMTDLQGADRIWVLCPSLTYHKRWACATTFLSQGLTTLPYALSIITSSVVGQQQSDGLSRTFHTVSLMATLGVGLIDGVIAELKV